MKVEGKVLAVGKLQLCAPDDRLLLRISDLITAIPLMVRPSTFLPFRTPLKCPTAALYIRRCFSSLGDGKVKPRKWGRLFVQRDMGWWFCLELPRVIAAPVASLSAGMKLRLAPASRNPAICLLPDAISMSGCE